MSSQEESKLSNLHAQPPAANSETIQWLWQSDADPWKEKDSTKWTWAPYSYEYSHLIENAFTQSQDLADLEDYEIDLKKMLQVNKNNRNKVRRVKREVNIAVQSRFMIELPPPIAIEKIQQTINPAFGNVQHFLDFIMKRTQETYALFQSLKELDLDCKQSHYKGVIQAVIHSIQKAAESHEKVTKSRGLPNWTSPIQEAKNIIAEIETKSNNPDLTLRDFLKLILRVYTMESFLCYWLNELLRSENWAEINVFTPYLVCLTYTFKVINQQHKPQGFIGILRTSLSSSIKLYRGTALRKEDLEFYRPGTRLFSWNGVTSTSRSKAQALSFIKMSLKKVKPGEKIGVLFTIKTESESANAGAGEGIIDVSKDSKYPGEEEVILAPGSVFKVTKCYLDKARNVYRVRLVLKKEFTKKHEILGEFQNKIIHNNENVVLNRESYEDIIKAMNLLEGNQLVISLKIENCVLDDHLVELIGNMIRTTNIKEENIEVANNEITIDSLIILCYTFSCKNLGKILNLNKVVMNNQTETVETKITNYRIKEICLDMITIYALSSKSLFGQFCKELCNENQVKRLSVDWIPSISHLKSVLTCIKELPKLQHLSLSLNQNTLEDVKAALTLLSPYTPLDFDFTNDSQASDEEMSKFKEAFSSLTSLTYLHLDFKNCKNISDQAICQFKDAINSLISLTYLHLDFSQCFKITNKGIEKFKNALKSLTSLTYLQLNFIDCREISEVGLKNLKDALKSLTLLTHLHLDFSLCFKISNKGMDKIRKVLKSHTSLTYLHLNFADCREISDVGIGSLRDGLKKLTLLAHVHLEFKNCTKISQKGIDALTNALKSVPDLYIGNQL